MLESSVCVIILLNFLSIERNSVRLGGPAYGVMQKLYTELNQCHFLSVFKLLLCRYFQSDIFQIFKWSSLIVSLFGTTTYLVSVLSIVWYFSSK